MPSVAQPLDINDDITVAMRAGNANELSVFFNKNIDLNIPNNEGIFSKAQAELIIKDFFDHYTTSDFTILHQGSSKDGAKYSIGNLVTDKGMFRVYYYMKKVEENYLIFELNLNEEEKDK
jgi:hypothetical protein